MSVNARLTRLSLLSVRFQNMERWYNVPCMSRSWAEIRVSYYPNVYVRQN